jgi:capsular polysaccharide biosynthesis protein
MPEHKTELLDYIRVFWKRKWLIIIPTLICALGTFLWSRLSDPVWEVDCLIQTGSLMVQTDAGILQEISASKPKDIAAQISQGSFNEPIATELNLSLKTFPPLTAEDIKDTRLVHVILKTEDIAEGKAILNSLFNHLKVDLDAKVEFERKAIDAQVKGKEIELENLDKTIPVLKSKVAIVRKRIDSISREMDEVKKRVDTLDKEQLEDLKKTGRAESESLAVLLYSNEVQQSLRYLDYLREMESDKKIQADEIRLDVENIIRRKNQIENDIALLVGKKARMELSQLIKNPTSSLRPVSPKPWLNLLIGTLLGLGVFTTLAFFLEYLGESQKQ